MVGWNEVFPSVVAETALLLDHSMVAPEGALRLAVLPFRGRYVVLGVWWALCEGVW